MEAFSNIQLDAIFTFSFENAHLRFSEGRPKKCSCLNELFVFAPHMQLYHHKAWDRMLHIAIFSIQFVPDVFEQHRVLQILWYKPPKPQEVYLQETSEVARCEQYGSGNGKERGATEGGGRVGSGYGSACPASDQGKRVLSVAKQCRCTIKNTLAADQCAQRSDGLALPERTVPGRRNTLR